VFWTAVLNPFARLDMGYRELKVAVEFDGAQHWTDSAQRTSDIDRHAELAALGWLIVRGQQRPASPSTRRGGRSSVRCAS